MFAGTSKLKKLNENGVHKMWLINVDLREHGDARMVGGREVIRGDSVVLLPTHAVTTVNREEGAAGDGVASASVSVASAGFRLCKGKAASWRAT